MVSGSCHACTAPAKYRCPRCTVPSCSLACSRKHKETSKCSGIRDPAQYIPAKEYGYQALMNDYTYLEDVSRKVGLANRERSDLHRDKSKVPRWVTEAGQMGLTVTLLGEGMQRRKENKSNWSPASKTLNLTLTFKLHVDSNTVVALTTPTNPCTSSLQDLIKKPFVDGRAAKVLSKDQLKLFRDSLESLRFFLLQEQDPRKAAYTYKPPESSKPPTPPPIQPQGPFKLHPSLPVKPSFTFGLESLPQGQISSAAPMSIPHQPPAITTEPPLQPLPALPPGSAPQPELTPQSEPNIQVPLPPSIIPAKRPFDICEPAPEATRKITYAELDGHDPLIKQLAGLSVIEWPIIDCHLNSTPQASLDQASNVVVEIKPPKSADISGDRVPVQKAVKLEGVGLAEGYGSSGEEENVDGEEMHIEDLLVPK